MRAIVYKSLLCYLPSYCLATVLLARHFPMMYEESKKLFGLFVPTTSAVIVVFSNRCPCGFLHDGFGFTRCSRSVDIVFRLVRA